MSNAMRERRDPRFYRRPGMGQSDMDLGYGFGASQGGPLLPQYRRDSLASSLQYGATPRPVAGALSKAYDETLRSQRKQLDNVNPRAQLTSNDYLTWMPKESGAIDASASGQSAVLNQPVVAAASGATEDPSRPKQSLEQLVANHVSALRESYVERAWGSFKAGDYQGSLRMFSLAEHASLDDPQERAYVRLSMVYAAIAAGQYAQAANCLEWVLSEASPAGRAGFPEAFNEIFERNHVSTIGELYVRPDGRNDSAEYQKHNLAVESIATATPDSARARAMVAVVEWGRGRRANAIFEAKKVRDPLNRLNHLGAVLEQADTLKQSSSTPGSNMEPSVSAPSAQSSQPAR